MNILCSIRNLHGSPSGLPHGCWFAGVANWDELRIALQDAKNEERLSHISGHLDLAEHWVFIRLSWNCVYLHPPRVWNLSPFTPKKQTWGAEICVSWRVQVCVEVSLFFGGCLGRRVWLQNGGMCDVSVFFSGEVKEAPCVFSFVSETQDFAEAEGILQFPWCFGII